MHLQTLLNKISKCLQHEYCQPSQLAPLHLMNSVLRRLPVKQLESRLDPPIPIVIFSMICVFYFAIFIFHNSQPVQFCMCYEE